MKAMVKYRRRMILLTDKEVNRLSEEWLDADEDVDWATMMNKAQLKKVVEYLQERWNGTEYEFYNIVAIPKEDWQSLLAKVE